MRFAKFFFSLVDPDQLFDASKNATGSRFQQATEPPSDIAVLLARVDSIASSVYGVSVGLAMSMVKPVCVNFGVSIVFYFVKGLANHLTGK